MAKEKKPIPLPRLNLTNKKHGFTLVLIGIVIALFLGILANIYSWSNRWIYLIFAIGIIVGILNIFHEEAILFLISGLAITFMLTLLVSSTLFPALVVTLFNTVIYLLAPANVIVSLKVLYALATK